MGHTFRDCSRLFLRCTPASSIHLASGVVPSAHVRVTAQRCRGNGRIALSRAGYPGAMDLWLSCANVNDIGLIAQKNVSLPWVVESSIQLFPSGVILLPAFVDHDWRRSFPEGTFTSDCLSLM